MFDLSRHPYFEKYTDPVSGVESFILTKKVGGLQRHFYFAQRSVTDDGKYLWVMCANPPARYFTFAVVSLDPDDPFIRHFPHASPDSGLPCISPDGKGVYYCMGNALYSVDVQGEVKKILELPWEYIKGRRLEQMCTHVSVSCDGKYVALDISISQKTYMAIGELATGKLTVLNKFLRCYNHAMFSPNRPDLILLDQDWSRDYSSGEYFPIDNRMWIMNTDGKHFEPLVPKMFYGRDGTEMAHDYWSDDGYVCWSDYYNGAFECNVDTKETNWVWQRPICHSHCSCDRRLFVGDNFPYTWEKDPCQVLFYDRSSNKEIAVFSAMPYNPLWAAGYHTDPHPQFCVKDEIIVSTTTVRNGDFDVAITYTKPLLERCREDGIFVVYGTQKPFEPGSWCEEIKTFG